MGKTFYKGITAHPHILRLVLEHLRNPEPQANSGATRADWRQPDLANCMRVSVTFNNIAAPILYKRVVTDDLYSLLENGDTTDAQQSAPPAAHPHIRSKAELLKLVTHLDVEYAEPGLDFTYTQLMQRRAGLRVKSDSDHVQHDIPAVCLWDTVAADSKDGVDGMIVYAHTRHLFALDILRQRRANGALPFQLETLSFCAQMGGYSPASEGTPMGHYLFGRSELTLARELIGPSGAKHICVRSTEGYLSISFGVQLHSNDIPTAQRPEFTAHMHEWTTTPPMEIRSATTYIHERPFHPRRGTMTIAQARQARLGRSFLYQPQQRMAAYDIAAQDMPCALIVSATDVFPRLFPQALKSAPDCAKRYWLTQHRVPIRFYGSSDVAVDSMSTISRAEQKAVVRQHEARSKAAIGDAARLYDFSMETLEMAPICRACGV